MENEVAIIGAGPIGLVLGKELAGRGIDVTIYDGKKEAGEHAERASGVVSATGIEGTGMGYRDAVINELKGAFLISGNGRVTVRAETTKAYVLDRAKLARIFFKEAEAAGARIRLGRRLGREEIKGMEAAVVVGADGAASTTASAFGFPPLERYVLTYKKTYRGRDLEREMAEVHFTSPTKGLFGWMIPYSEERLELGVGVDSKKGVTSLRAFNDFFELGGYDGLDADGDGRASMIPLMTRRRTAMGNVILVGDAAGQVKSTTGGGIVFGSLCAKAGADAIERHMKKGGKLTDYERIWRSRYGMELGLHNAIHALYSAMGQRGMERFLRMADAAGLGPFLSEYGDMDMPSKIIKRLIIR